MIIVCPQCSTEYALNGELFGAAARVVQCTACGRRWRQPPEATAAPAAAEPVAAEADVESANPPAVAAREAAPTPAVPDAVDAPEAPPEGASPHDGDRDGDVGEEEDAGVADLPLARPRRRPAWAVMAAAAAITLVALSALLILVQQPLVRAFPAADAVYRLVGLSPGPVGVGLALRDVTSMREWTGQEDVLLVAGSVVNVAEQRLGVPSVRVALIDAGDAEVQAVVVVPQRETLSPGEHARFEARIASPQAAAKRMVVSFAAAEDRS